MKAKSPHDIAASVRGRLIYLSRQNGEEFGLLLSRFARERFLYRLSISPYHTMFLLKGATLFTTWQNIPRRATRDVDFQVNPQVSKERLAKMFRDICDTSAPEDGMNFDSSTVIISLIRNTQSYGGYQVSLLSVLAGARIPLRMDIGFGDIVTPQPIQKEFPTILSLPAPQLWLYPSETVIAEKWQAIVDLGMSNSRMKDFFDIWILSKYVDFDGIVLTRAIKATFDRRHTILPSDLPEGLKEKFGIDTAKVAQWRTFLRKSQLNDVPELNVILVELRMFLWPIMMALQKDTTFTMQWTPNKGWRD